MTNEERTAHIAELILTNDVTFEWKHRSRGAAYRGRPRLGESAHVVLPEVRGQMTYFICLHELGHILSPNQGKLNVLEREADAWNWAFANTEDEPTIATLRGVKRRLVSYFTRAFYRANMEIPGEGSQFHTLMKWLSEVTA